MHRKCAKYISHSIAPQLKYRFSPVVINAYACLRSRYRHVAYISFALIFRPSKLVRCLFPQILPSHSFNGVFVCSVTPSMATLTRSHLEGLAPPVVGSFQTGKTIYPWGGEALSVGWCRWDYDRLDPGWYSLNSEFGTRYLNTSMLHLARAPISITFASSPPFTLIPILEHPNTAPRKSFDALIGNAKLTAEDDDCVRAFIGGMLLLLLCQDTAPLAGHLRLRCVSSSSVLLLSFAFPFCFGSLLIFFCLFFLVHAPVSWDGFELWSDNSCLPIPLFNVQRSTSTPHVLMFGFCSLYHSSVLRI